MGSISIPYMAVSGSLIKILEKIKEAATPENFNQDFLSTKLGFNGGNYRTFIPWAKKVGLINTDGTPNQLYKRFRNPSTSRIAMAEALRIGYKELYSRNEYCHELDRAKFKELVMDATGEPHDSKVVELIVSCFFNAKTIADFDNKIPEEGNEPKGEIVSEDPKLEYKNKKGLALGLNYTINLVLPKTDDPAIFNAIFRSLKENLLNE